MLRTVLLADDEPAVRGIVEKILRAAGYSVVVCRNASEARKFAAQHPGHIDVLISDVVMPGASGVDLARELQMTRPQTKVLLMSGYFPDHLTFVEGWKFLHKPFSSSTLTRALENLLNEE